MTPAAVPGSNASAARSVAIPAADTLERELLVRLADAIDGIGLLLVVGLLLGGLILITAGCGPPN